VASNTGRPRDTDTAVTADEARPAGRCTADQLLPPSCDVRRLPSDTTQAAEPEKPTDPVKYGLALQGDCTGVAIGVGPTPGEGLAVPADWLAVPAEAQLATTSMTSTAHPAVRTAIPADIASLPLSLARDPDCVGL
jgi:hypothetical protein